MTTPAPAPAPYAFAPAHPHLYHRMPATFGPPPPPHHPYPHPHPHPHPAARVLAPAPPTAIMAPGASPPIPGSWRTPGRAWTAEMDMALVRAFCRHSNPSPGGPPPARNFWPAVVKDMLATSAPVALSHEDEREMCDSSRHRLKRLRQYAAQIHLILHHPSGTFTWHPHTARVVPAHAAPNDAVAWSLIGNVKLRNRVRDGVFAWYPLLAQHIDEADIEHAQTPTLFAATAPAARGTSRKRRSTGQSVASSVSSVDEPSTPSDTADADASEPAPKRPRHGSVARSESDDDKTLAAPEPSKAGLAALGKGKRTWTTERDVALVECYMANRALMPAEPSARPTSSVWRRIVRSVFGPSLTAGEEREAGDSARHRLKKLKGYAAQVQKLLSANEPMFVWSDAEARLQVARGLDVGATWSKIRNPQVRNRLIRAHYPWLRALAVNDSDLPSTFYSTTLGPEYFDAPASLNNLEQRFLPHPTTGPTPREPSYYPPPPPRQAYNGYRSPPSYHLPPPPARGSPSTMPPAPMLRHASSSTDPSQHSVLPPLPPLGAAALRRSPPAYAAVSARSPEYHPSSYRSGAGAVRSPPTLPPIHSRSPTGIGREASPPALMGAGAGSGLGLGSEDATGSVTRSSRIILTDLEKGLFSPESSRRYLLLLPRLDPAQRELFESVRQFDAASPSLATSAGADARARQAYALLNDWLPAA